VLLTALQLLKREVTLRARRVRLLQRSGDAGAASAIVAPTSASQSTLGSLSFSGRFVDIRILGRLRLVLMYLPVSGITNDARSGDLGDIGSPRVSGSTNASNAPTSSGSHSVNRGRPAPGRRTRPASSLVPSRNSAIPRTTVFLPIPVARTTAAIPPRPCDLASAAAHRRRDRSFNNPCINPYRSRIALSSITHPDFYAHPPNPLTI